MEGLDQEQLKIIKEMSGEDKLRVALQLNLDARKIKAAYLKLRHSDWSEELVNAEVKRIFLYATT